MWFVSDQRQTIPSSEVDRYLELVSGTPYGNARLVQPINGRTITYGEDVLSKQLKVSDLWCVTITMVVVVVAPFGGSDKWE
ncbi:hypothetical protein BWQ96_08783 [Gracilariopsis chorda]|uniref:Uncharacterized protein n=1 Tax=Gracilariopsis chorda TaxID=448386 RepID=A0A2V3IHD8_9FLOR|nr:hypothetical protein BWQ96_08783 [Gracilariopsis chorda]|eukprot:PXF41501.1 hypothetical protein BWQ96_08783 [Gracilariopsis chorda]